MNIKAEWATSIRPPLRIAGLFAGIGGFELGLGRSGHEATYFCELDTAARAVLNSRFPSVEFVADVREIGVLPKEIDIVTAGFPCQDLSSSGLKAGIEGSRSSLVAEVFRIIERRPVEWILIENVHFMLHLAKGAGIRAITDHLSRLGYNWAYRVMDSNSFGLPQRRRRVFLLASLSHDPRDVLLSDDHLTHSRDVPDISQPIGFYWTEGTYATGLAANAIPPLKGGSAIGIPSPPAILMPDGEVGTPDINDAERFQGFPEGWTIDAARDHKATLRWKLVGNAVSVNAAEWLGKKLRCPHSYDSNGDLPLNRDKTWPNAAWSMGKGAFASKASAYPADYKAPALDVFLSHKLKPLSHRATSGFLSRAKKGNLRFPEGFIQTLERNLENANG
jgi:DNA (cytosine-5)-methyltransferase 1